MLSVNVFQLLCVTLSYRKFSITSILRLYVLYTIENKSQALQRDFNQSCHNNGELWSFEKLLSFNQGCQLYPILGYSTPFRHCVPQKILYPWGTYFVPHLGF
jgi:hypothetical protein